MRTIWIVCIVAIMLATLDVRAQSGRRVAPDMSLEAERGNHVHLAALKGKVVLVDFWASWCVPCQTSFPALDSLYREFEPRGLEVLAVNVDERRKDADAFLTVHPHTLPVLFDPKGEAPKAFGVKGMPTSFLIDRAGAIRFTHTGYTADVGQKYRHEIELLLLEP